MEIPARLRANLKKNKYLGFFNLEYFLYYL